MPLNANSQPRSEHAHIGAFSLQLPSPVNASATYDRNSPSLREYKDLLRDLTGDILRPNALGYLAAGLLLGRMDRSNTSESRGLYTLDGEGKGITFPDPDTLFRDWSKQETGVGVALQMAMRNLIDSQTGVYLDDLAGLTPEQTQVFASRLGSITASERAERFLVSDFDSMTAYEKATS